MLLGALRACRKEYFGRRGVGILFEKMVLDFPGVVDAELVGEFNLVERLLKQPVLRRHRSTAAEADARRKCRISWTLPRGFVS